MSSSLTPQQKPQSLFLLKVLVIGMGVLILAGLGVVVVTIATRIGGGRPAATATTATTATTTKAPTLALTHHIPPGATIVDMTADGPRLYLRLRLADGSQRIDIVDVGTGRAEGSIAIVPGAP